MQTGKKWVLFSQTKQQVMIIKGRFFSGRISGIEKPIAGFVRGWGGGNPLATTKSKIMSAFFFLNQADQLSHDSTSCATRVETGRLFCKGPHSR